MASKFLIDYFYICAMHGRRLFIDADWSYLKKIQPFFKGSAIQQGAHAGAFSLAPSEHCRKKHDETVMVNTLAPSDLVMPGDGWNFRRKSIDHIIQEYFAKKLDVGDYTFFLRGYEATLECSFGSRGDIHEYLYLIHNIFHNRYGDTFQHFCDNFNEIPFYEYRRLPWFRSTSERTSTIKHSNERIKIYLRTLSQAKNIVRFEVSRKEGKGDLGNIYPDIFHCVCRKRGRGKEIRLMDSREKLSDAIVDHIERESGMWIVRFQDILDELGIMREKDRFYPVV